LKKNLSHLLSEFITKTANLQRKKTKKKRNPGDGGVQKNLKW